MMCTVLIARHSERKGGRARPVKCKLRPSCRPLGPARPETSLSISDRRTTRWRSARPNRRSADPVAVGRLRAKARVTARGAVAPFEIERQAEHDAAISNSAKMASSASASFWNAVRGRVLSGEARRRSTSDRASPIVLVPRSIPIRRALAGRRRAKSSTAIGRFIASGASTAARACRTRGRRVCQRLWPRCIGASLPLHRPS